jgi:PPOX class probable F420-dependent enzyme
MTDAEAYAFLEQGTRTVKIATVRADGRPHVAPVWFGVDGAALVFSTTSGSVKARNLARDPRVAATVDDEQPPFAFVTVTGLATCTSRPDDFLFWTTRIARRYVGDARAEEVGQRYLETDDLLVRIGVTAIRGFADVIG